MDSTPSPSPAPASIKEFEARLLEVADRLPKRLKQCADYVAANQDRIAVSTVAEMAEGAGVQSSAFMRFCQILGFSGFSEMQRLFRETYAGGWPDYSTRLLHLRETAAGRAPALLAEFAEAGRTSLEGLLKTIEPEALEKAVELLASANTIHIIGIRRAFPVASYLAYALEKMAVPAMLHSAVGKLENAAGFDLVKGFAVGRTIFAEAARKWLSGTIDDAQAIAEMAARYQSLCDVWDKARAY